DACVHPQPELRQDEAVPAQAALDDGAHHGALEHRGVQEAPAGDACLVLAILAELLHELDATHRPGHRGGSAEEPHPAELNLSSPDGPLVEAIFQLLELLLPRLGAVRAPVEHALRAV